MLGRQYVTWEFPARLYTNDVSGDKVPAFKLENRRRFKWSVPDCWTKNQGIHSPEYSRTFRAGPR